MGKHLIFYDGECGLCDRVVQFLIKRDKNKVFDFAPLQGKTAEEWLKPPPSADTVVLIEDYQGSPNKYILSKAAFRALWLMGGPWAILGLFNFLPGFSFDWAYRIVAQNRKSLFSQDRCVLPDPEDKSRYLP
ncbi:MAG: DUF393 domain-containing protein [Chlamydiia bacterium]|nr:DUF393 domain-containing protein [Chlamydiia bacterium]